MRYLLSILISTIYLFCAGCTSQGKPELLTPGMAYTDARISLEKAGFEGIPLIGFATVPEGTDGYAYILRERTILFILVNSQSRRVSLMGRYENLNGPDEFRWTELEGIEVNELKSNKKIQAQSGPD